MNIYSYNIEAPEGVTDAEMSDPVHLAAPGQSQVNVLSPPLAERVAETFRALGDPARVRIIAALAGRELCVCHLADALDMSQSAVSHQLRTLRHLRLVRSHKQGRQVFYTLDDQHIEELFRRALEHIIHG